jgi:hypothetical protein
MPGTLHEDLITFVQLSTVRNIFYFTTIRRNPFFEFPWKQSTVLLLTTISVAEKIQWGFLLNFHDNDVYANAFYCPLQNRMQLTCTAWVFP